MRESSEADNPGGAGHVPKVFLLDVDGVMTDGTLYYSVEGKCLKCFGPDDNDALSLLSNFIRIRFITGDKRGLPITKKRIVDDMGYPLDLVSTIRRIEWISEQYDPAEVVYMGDGIFDHYVMRKVGYAIAPANADPEAKKAADYVTARNGGDRAVAEAALHIMAKYFTPYDPMQLPSGKRKMSGAWKV